jgi:hypothetical protein
MANAPAEWQDIDTTTVSTAGAVLMPGFAL